ncbi:MSHA biogenesis protein MshN [Georgfuchsia toluolica]|uniref:MSHA biogenesis protein MshN n=1 Tax=Georgfuchsia toluolica TaxID=424218 RepID=A0A916J737_9PROT|nr:tetratricopeptide repeat protein [Georgfuchsia toluolica]CAG4885198.1 MSHA biogenesis protein MshN [Georgfuchsia toluolica]
MSLVNKMLQDLDQRHASELEKQGISRHVRTLPAAPPAVSWKGIVLACLGALAGAFIVWLLLTWKQESKPIVPSPQATAPAVALAPSPVSVPLPSFPPDESAPPAAKVAPAPHKEVRSPAARSDRQEPALKLDRSLDANAAERHRASSATTAVDRGNASEVPFGNSIIEKQPRTAAISDASDAEYRKGMNLLRRGTLADAAVALRAALRIDAHHVAARQALLSLLVDQKQWNEAETIGLDGLALDQKQIGWAMLAARLQVERGDNPAALKTLDQYAPYAERNADYMGFHALLLQKAKRLPEAVERYRAALALKPGEGRWWYGLGLALEAGQHPTEAKDAYTQARNAGNLPADLAAQVEWKLKGQ